MTTRVQVKNLGPDDVTVGAEIVKPGQTSTDHYVYDGRDVIVHEHKTTQPKQEPTQ